MSIRLKSGVRLQRKQQGQGLTLDMIKKLVGHKSSKLKAQGSKSNVSVLSDCIFQSAELTKKISELMGYEVKELLIGS